MEANTSPKEKYIYTMTVGGYTGDVARFVAAVKSMPGFITSRLGKTGPDRDVEIDFTFEGRPDKSRLIELAESDNLSILSPPWGRVA